MFALLTEVFVSACAEHDFIIPRFRVYNVSASD